MSVKHTPALRLPGSLGRLIGGAFLTVAGAIALSGCGGSSNNAANTPSFVGNYRGVYLQTAGPGSPSSGTLTFNVGADGTIAAVATGTNGVGTTGTGTVGAGGSSTASGSLNLGGTVASNATGIVTQDPVTHALSATYTAANGIVVTIQVGPVVTNTPLAGTFSGTTSPSDGGTNKALATIAPTGTVTGTVTTATETIPLTGFIDSNGIAYLAYVSGNIPQYSVGKLTLAGTNLTGTLQTSRTTGGPLTLRVALSNSIT